MSEKANLQQEKEDYLKREEERAERRKREEHFQRQKELHSSLTTRPAKGVSAWAKMLLFFYFMLLALFVTLYFGVSKKGAGPFEQLFQNLGI